MKALWEKYKEIDSKTADEIEKRVESFYESPTGNIFDGMLDGISNAFEYWRYIYEHSSGGLNLGFLINFRNALRDTCCWKYYKMSYDDYLKR